jgi:hypothetical protein
MSSTFLAFLFLVGLGGGLAGRVQAREETIPVPGGKIAVAIDDSLAASAPDLRRWIDRAATAVGRYYGRFPVTALRLEVRARPGDPVSGGREYEGRFIRIHVDPAVTDTGLRHDWMLTHEMFHLGFPSLDPAYHYLEEGLSDYLEPLARARAGQTRPTQPWKDFIEGMPQGVPVAGEGGLDGTRDWGRIYWGGCIFWLLVDLDIRERTGNQRSLDDAIRAIVAAGGTGGSDWTLERVMRVGDAATGVDSIRRFHDHWGPHAVDPHLDSLWRKLGVAERGGIIVFDDSAPLAALRRALTQSVSP